MAMRLNPTTGQYEYVSQAGEGQPQSMASGNSAAFGATPVALGPGGVPGYGGGSASAAPVASPTNNFDPNNPFLRVSGFAGQKAPATAAPAATPGVPDLSSIGNLGNALNTAGSVNQFNLDYYRGAEQSDPIFGAAQRLLNPNDSQANYDVNMHGAELAAARGVPGSGLAGETTGRIRQADIERRAGLANQLLSGAHSRVPAPFDVGSQLLTAAQQGQLSLSQAELALQREVQLGHLDLQRAQYYLSLLRGGQGGGGSGGGGNRNAPLPGQGGGAPSQSYDPRTGPAFQSYNPLQLPEFGPRGAASATASPPITAPDNWDLMTPQEQQQYALQYRSNPANYGQDPWSGDEGNWDVGSSDWSLGNDWYD